MTRRGRVRTLAIVAALLLSVGVIGTVTLRSPAPALASCVPQTMSGQIKAARNSASPKRTKAAKPAPTKTAKPTRTAPAKTTAPSASQGSDSRPHPIQSAIQGIKDGIGNLIDGVQKALGIATPSPSASSAAPAPSTSASGKPAPGPTAKSAPTAVKHTPKPTPTEAATPCPIVPKLLAAASGQVDVEETPAIQTTKLLTMTGLSYDGNVNLPTKDGTVEVLKFTMDTAVSTPFELDVTEGSATMKLNSSQLTVSGHVIFYTSEMKGNLLGLIPIDFTPASPPPLTIPDLFFTNVTISLIDVESDSLTADNLTIS